MSDKPYQDASVPYTLDEAIDELEKWLGNEEPLFPIEQAISDLHWLRELRAERDALRIAARAELERLRKEAARLQEASNRSVDRMRQFCADGMGLTTDQLGGLEGSVLALAVEAKTARAVRDAAREQCDTAQREAAALRAILTRIAPDALRAHDAGEPLPAAGWYALTEHGGRTHVLDVVSTAVAAELDALRAVFEALPRCAYDECNEVATMEAPTYVIGDYEMRCDEHAKPDEWGHQPWSLSYAAAVRRLEGR